ncbi:fatty acid desaturase [Pendulispora albinea]|uniref:Fatty acid desaturase n=1 Tax=Pendulispora albinea TaxID=2741071 RepID=A0ABZ2LSP2_9BACT
MSAKNSPSAAFGLRYGADIAPLLLILAVAIAQLAVIWFKPALRETLIIAGVLFLPQVAVATVVHNHSHVPIFRSAVANRILEVFMFLQTGMFASKFRLHHELGHHLHYTDPTKDPSRWVYRDGSEMHRFVYILHYFFTYNYHCIRIGRRFKKKLSGSIWHTLLCWAVFAALLVAAGPIVLSVYGIPMIAVWLTFICLTYDDHISLTGTDPYESSHTKTNRLLNLVFFNNGYHLAHHIKPGLHWTELPAFHESIAPRIKIPGPVTAMNRLLS